MERAHWERRFVVALGLVLAVWPCAFALDPSLDVNQYAHTVWKISEGFYKGTAWSITQTSDGYLWLGTEFGLLRFDGVRAVPWEPPAGEHLPSNDVRSVYASRDGRLWIGTYRGLVSWKDSKLTHYPELDGDIVEAILEDREGTTWVVAGWTLSAARLCKFQNGQTECYGKAGGPGSGVTSIYEDSRGNLWAGAMAGVWHWNPGPPTLYRMAGPPQRTYALVESDDGGILIARSGGITKLKNGAFEAFPLPAALQFSPQRLLRDRDGGLWIGALVDQGLLHFHQGKGDVLTPADGVSGDLSGHAVRCFFEDREGSVWVSTPTGLDRFREFAIPTFSIQQGFSSRAVSSILSGQDGSIWLGTSDGLNRWNKGRITIYRKRSARGGTFASGLTAGQLAEPGSSVRQLFGTGLPHDELQSLFEDNTGNIWAGTAGGLAVLENDRFYPVRSIPSGNLPSITGDVAGNVWVSHEEGLFHVLKTHVVERIPWAKFGHTAPASALMYDAVQSGLWLGFREGGVAFLKDGQLRASYGRAEGFAGGVVHSFYRDEGAALWAATAGGLSRIKDHQVLTLASQDGLPCDNVHWMIEDRQLVWLYTACGLVRISRSEFDAWVSHPKQRVQLTVFDVSDGVRNHASISGYSPIVAKAADGKIWFTTSDGVSIIDVHHLSFNRVAPPVQIEQVIADDKPYDASNGMRLPPRIHNLAIDYTALSLVAPEKVRFRYQLEGQDKDWREVVNDREVQYTNLPPKHYRFRVLACNNSGVWNDEGAFLDFVIPPAWYQTNWFRSLCAAVFLALLWTLHQLRLRQQARQFSMTLEARVGERTRIARELHDTLLQSFHGLLARFQSVVQLLPERPLDARQRLESTIEQAAEAITEARDAVQGLRSSTVVTNELTLTLKTLGEELALNNANTSPHFRVEVLGNPRELHPIVRDEVYRVAAEALRNAFVHAQADLIELEIRYDDRELVLTIRDDGQGINAKVLAAGESGHYGLPGMHERAKLVGGNLEVWSQRNEGTEIQLTIPAANAYASLVQRGSWIRRFSRKDKEMRIQS